MRCAVRGTRTSLGAECAKRAVPPRPDQPGGSWRRLGCEAQGPIPLAGPERIQAPGTQYPDALHPVLVPDSGKQGCPGTETASGGMAGQEQWRTEQAPEEGGPGRVQARWEPHPPSPQGSTAPPVRHTPRPTSSAQGCLAASLPAPPRWAPAPRPSPQSLPLSLHPDCPGK